MRKNNILRNIKQNMEQKEQMLQMMIIGGIVVFTICSSTIYLEENIFKGILLVGALIAFLITVGFALLMELLTYILQELRK